MEMFVQQKARSQQLLNSLQWKSLARSYLLSTLKAELANLVIIYTSYKPLILTATQQLKREPSFNGMSSLSKCTKRSLLPFLGDTLSLFTRTAMTKDIRDIKRRINQPIETQAQQQDTLVHVILILNVARYAMKVKTTHQHSNTNSSEDTQPHHHTLQHHQFDIYPYKLLANTTTHSLHSG